MRLLKIGRDPGCDITINNSRVSSLHAEMIVLNNGDILLEDKGSTNGTFVQNRQLKPGKAANIRRGDLVRFAEVELQWSQVPLEDNTGYKGVWGIGKDLRNYFQVAGDTVSRFHATVKQATDGKIYIIDHSKNGTTVDGNKIMPNNPTRIKKSSVVACGNVPVDLSRLPWPTDVLKITLGTLAGLLLLAAIGFGIYKWTRPDPNVIEKWEINAAKDTCGINAYGDTIETKKYRSDGIITDEEIYNRYKTSVVFLQGVFHFKVTAGDMDEQQLLAVGLPSEILPVIDQTTGSVKYKLAAGLSQEDRIRLCANYTGTGFFISEGGKDEGKLITNLHVVKPWLFEKIDNRLVSELLESLLRQEFAKVVQDHDFIRHLKGRSASELSAYISQIKVEGVLDKIVLVPYGKRYDPENYIKCELLSAGESNVDKDVALIQSVQGEIPKGCTYVDVDNMMDISADAIKVPKHICTLGYPFGTALQTIDNEHGLQIFFNGGNINKDADEFKLFFNAVSFHGASGSPVFNEYGKLVGVVSSGVDKSQGFNGAIKAKYVRELLDKRPYTK